MAVIGEGARLAGYALAGATVVPAETGAAVRAAWQALPADVAVVILTAQAARCLEPGRRTDVPPLVVVMPE